MDASQGKPNINWRDLYKALIPDVHTGVDTFRFNTNGFAAATQSLGQCGFAAVRGTSYKPVVTPLVILIDASPQVAKVMLEAQMEFRLQIKNRMLHTEDIWLVVLGEELQVYHFVGFRDYSMHFNPCPANLDTLFKALSGNYNRLEKAAKLCEKTQISFNDILAGFQGCKRQFDQELVDLGKKFNLCGFHTLLIIDYDMNIRENREKCFNFIKFCGRRNRRPSNQAGVYFVSIEQFRAYSNIIMTTVIGKTGTLTWW